jgi:dynein heavy chain
VESATSDKWGPERWEHSMVAVRAVPHWKVFSFAGKTGDLSLEAGSPTGTFQNDLLVLETGSATPDQWVSPATVGELPPPRADSPIAYDPGNSALLLFGGWSNRWLGDLWLCRVSGTKKVGTGRGAGVGGQGEGIFLDGTRIYIHV